MLRFEAVPVGSGSGVSCAWCSPPAPVRYDSTAVVLERVAQVAGGWSTRPGPNVVLSGPEPFNHPELPALVVGCIERGVERLGIETDGGALSVGGNAAGAIRAGVRHLRVRALGFRDGRADASSERRALARSAREGIGAALEAADSLGVTIVVTVLLPVCQHTIDVLPAAVAESAGAGAHAVRIVPGGSLPPSASTLLAAACDTGMVNRLWVEVDGSLPLPASHTLHAVSEERADG